MLYIVPASIPDTNAPIDICTYTISNKNRDKPKLIFLSENKKIKCVEVSSRGNVFWELNNPEDVQRIEKVIS